MHPLPISTPPEHLALISCREAAKILHVHPRTIRRRVEAGTISGFRIGPRIIRVPAEEIARLLTPVITAPDAA